MRIAFHGKGGSGKTTVAAAFALWLARQNYPVLAIDADVNVNLGSALGTNKLPAPLGDHCEVVKTFVHNGRKDVKIAELISTTPPSKASRFIGITKNDDIIERFSVRCNSLRLMVVGSYKAEERGATCYHGKLNSLQILLHHLLDQPNEWVVVDSTAGIDSLGTTLHFAYDLNIFVVEPTLRSIEVVKDFVDKTRDLNIPVMVLANKIRSQKDLDFIEAQVGQIPILGSLTLSERVQDFDQQITKDLSEFAKENDLLFESLENYCQKLKRDWNVYLRNLRASNKAAGQSWYNVFFQRDISVGLESDFDYNRVSLKTG
jgi:CO dehydrogenase maturation factor